MNELLECPNCKKAYYFYIEKCENCGYPFSGTDLEKSHFVAQNIMKSCKIIDTSKSIKIAKFILISIGSFNCFISLFLFNSYFNYPIIYLIAFLIGIIFIFSGVFIRKNPIIAITIPFLMLLIDYILQGIADYSLFMRFIIFKLVIICLLIYSLVKVIEAEKLKKESNYLSKHNF